MSRLVPGHPPLLVLLLLSACTPAAAPAAYQEAQALERAGDLQRALAAYGRCVAWCGGRRDERCAQYRLRAADTLAALSRWSEASERYLALATWGEVPAVAARAGAMAAELMQRRLGQEQRALTLCRRVVLAYPGEVGAESALEQLSRAYLRQGRWQALAALLRQLYGQLGRSPLGPRLLFDAAGLYRDQRQPDEALGRCRLLASAHPRSTLVDDCLWLMGQLAEERGAWADALDAYRRLLATRKDAFLMGSYNSVYLDDAQLRTAEILADRLGRPGEAMAALETLRDDFLDSTLRDDAQLRIARLQREAARPEQACEALGRLARDFPDGNRVAEAARLARSWGCPAGAGGRP